MEIKNKFKHKTINSILFNYRARIIHIFQLQKTQHENEIKVKHTNTHKHI